jgi:hypothetical protein
MVVYAARLMETTMPPAYESVNNSDDKNEDAGNFPPRIATGY